jgi:D-beta-D-heptose 7-phosphate kinase/D-beta-D-heptose 1-phosphate adenosyltransferase
MNILVIGESCNDIFYYGKVERLSPEAPVPILQKTKVVKTMGMAHYVYDVMMLLKNKGDFIKLITQDEIEINKIRYVDEKSNQKLLRVDENDYVKYPYKFNIGEYSSSYLKSFDCIVISDYNKGFLSESDIELLSDDNHIILDTKKKLGDWAVNVYAIKINNIEFEENKEWLLNSYLNLGGILIVTHGSDKTMVYHHKSTWAFNIKDKQEAF